jgi:hypothetical protein
MPIDTWFVGHYGGMTALVIYTAGVQPIYTAGVQPSRTSPSETLRGPTDRLAGAREVLRGVDAVNSFHIAARRFALFRLVKYIVSAGQRSLCAWFDSRQLH